MSIAKLARINVEDWAVVTATYRAALHDVPGDLLAEAGARLMRSWDNGYRLPLPAEIRALVADEMGRRLSGLARVQAALMTAQRTGPRCETRAEVEARRQERARMIDEAARLGPPPDRPDTRCPVEKIEEENGK